MKKIRGWNRTVGTLALGLLLGGLVQQATAQYVETKWNSTSSGRWDDPSKWDKGAPAATNYARIENTGTKTVTIDDATPTDNLRVGRLLVQYNNSTLLLSGNTSPLVVTNDLYLQNSGALVVDGGNLIAGKAGVANIYMSTYSTMTLTNSGTCTVSNELSVGGSVRGTVNIHAGGRLRMLGNLNIGYSGTGVVNMTDGELTTAGCHVGRTGRGVMTVAGGTWLTTAGPQVGNSSGGDGLLSISGGNSWWAYESIIGNNAGAIGDLRISGGVLAITNAAGSAYARLGYGGGKGAVTVSSNGLWIADRAYLASAAGARGTVTVEGGNWVVKGPAVVGHSGGGEGRVVLLGGVTSWSSGGNYSDIAANPNATGTVIIAGGTLTVTNLSKGNGANIGPAGVGSMIVSNGLFLADYLQVGRNAASVGKLDMVGGLVQAFNYMNVAATANSTGTVTISGGELTVTNDAWAYLNVGQYGYGRIVITGGQLTAKRIYLCYGVGGVGEMEINGGVCAMPYGNSGFDIGASFSNQTGRLTVAGGLLAVTNATGTQSLFVGGKGYGSLTLNGGTSTVDVIVHSTNSALCAFAFNGGTLNTKLLTITNGQPFVVGNGTSLATLNLINGTHRFNDGLVLNTNSALRVADTNAIGKTAFVGGLTLREGSRLEWAFNATTQDVAYVSGTLTIEGGVNVALTSLGGALPQRFALIAAAGVTGNTAGWPQSLVNGQRYEAYIAGNMLWMRKASGGTCIIVR